MPNISWYDIKRRRPLVFAHEWQHVASEQAEKQTFWNEFFDIFGISCRLVVTLNRPSNRRLPLTDMLKPMKYDFD